MFRYFYHTYHRYRTLQTGYISALPVVILMPHSACNCRCVMCDIWKDNRNLKQLTENDIAGLLASLKKLGTRSVVMSGGEPLLNTNFFRLCELLRQQNIKITLLTTGLSIQSHAEKIVRFVNDVIVSLDGNEQVHDRIRNVQGAYKKLSAGVRYLKSLEPGYRITARTVIHRLNFRHWPSIIDSAREIGLDQISFLPADVTSHAFNRLEAWNEPKQHEILIAENELPELQEILHAVISGYKHCFKSGFIAESPEKLQKIYAYYAAFYRLNQYPYKKCNAPWVSAVIEADGTVRPCFFHEEIGNIHHDALSEILNGGKASDFRKTLNMDSNSTCEKCVCYLNLTPQARI